MTSWRCPLCGQDVPIRRRWDGSRVLRHTCTALGENGWVGLTETPLTSNARLMWLAVALFAVVFAVALWWGR